MRVESERGAETVPADSVVMALGVDSAALLAPLGVKVPLYPVKGYSATLPVIDDEKPRAPRSWTNR